MASPRPCSFCGWLADGQCQAAPGCARLCRAVDAWGARELRSGAGRGSQAGDHKNQAAS